MFSNISHDLFNVSREHRKPDIILNSLLRISDTELLHLGELVDAEDPPDIFPVLAEG